MTRQHIATAVFPETSGIYIFRDGNAPLYVGQTRNFKRRLNSYYSHQAARSIEAHFPNSTVELIEVPVNKLDEIEREYIAKLGPPFNGGITMEFIERYMSDEKGNLYWTWKHTNHPKHNRIGGAENARRMWNEYINKVMEQQA